MTNYSLEDHNAYIKEHYGLEEIKFHNHYVESSFSNDHLVFELYEKPDSRLQDDPITEAELIRNDLIEGINKQLVNRLHVLAVETLHPQELEAYRLVYIDGYTQTETARIMKITVGAVNQSLIGIEKNGKRKGSIKKLKAVVSKDNVTIELMEEMKALKAMDVSVLIKEMGKR